MNDVTNLKNPWGHDVILCFSRIFAEHTLKTFVGIIRFFFSKETRCINLVFISLQFILVYIKIVHYWFDGLKYDCHALFA